MTEKGKTQAKRKNPFPCKARSQYGESPALSQTRPLEGELIAEVMRARGKVGHLVRARMRELQGNKDWFSEMCFCLMTANYTAEGGMRIQEEGGDFSKLSHKEINSLLKRCGHRFPNARAAYINEAKGHKGNLVCLPGMRNSMERREWLVKNVKGFGYKEASHFLRNIGFFDVAIIDRHILSILSEYGLIRKPKTLSKKNYLAIEQALGKLSSKLGISQGELDFYLWYLKTGKVLK